MKKEISAKDYVIYKVKYYGEERLKKKNEKKFWEQHRLRANKFINWRNELNDFVTGKPRAYWNQFFGLFISDAMTEVLHEEHGIISFDAESSVFFYVPREDERVINFFNTTMPKELPVKIMKRCRYSTMLNYKEPNDIHRSICKECLKAQIERDGKNIFIEQFEKIN